jgi:hypothetical protein
MVDAAFGEVMVTCEKIWWLVKEGRQYLIPEKRKAGAMATSSPQILNLAFFFFFLPFFFLSS